MRVWARVLGAIVSAGLVAWSASASAECSADIDCGGDLTCRNGHCVVITAIPAPDRSSHPSPDSSPDASSDAPPALPPLPASPPAPSQTPPGGVVQAAPVVAPAPVVLTGEQIAAFADMVNDPENTVAARLRADPHLASMAAGAVEAREHRKHSGVGLMVSGIIVLAVTDVLGSALVLTTPGYPGIDGTNAGQFAAGLAIALVGDAVGLSLAIPGIVKLSAKTDDEKLAIDAYVTGDAPPATPRPPVPITGTTGGIRLPLLSLSF
jgi:hypothetical protein